MNGWLGMQEKMLKGWWDVLAKPQQNGHTSSSFNSLWDLWLTSGLEQWQTFYQDAFAAASQQMRTEVSKNAAAQFLSGQAQSQQLLSLITEAWQSMLTNATSPAEWQGALGAFTDQMRQQLAATLDSAKLLENSAELWRLYDEEAQKFVQPWLGAWWQTPTFMSKLGGVDRAEATNTFMQLYQAAFEQTWGRALMAPSMGLLREFNEKVNKGFALWLENQQSMLTYQLLVGEAWVDAFQALMQKLIDMAQKGETITDQRQLLRIWVEVADEIFIELFHSDAYAKAQGAYVNSNMALRRQQRELLEVWLRNNDVPTRTDLDEAHHQIYQLRKEVKALKKMVGTNETQPAPTIPTAKAKRPARSASKSHATAAGKATPEPDGSATDERATQGDSDTPNPDRQSQEGAA